MPQNKKQHYVPKFYLKRFTPNERLINLYNLKSRRKIIGASLSGQCSKDYMYGTDGQTENALSLIEGETSKLFKQIDEIISLPKPLTEQHLTMLLHILIQHGRTKYATEELDEITDKMTKETWGAYFKEQHGIDINKFKITIKDSARFSVQMSMRMYPLLMDLHYKLLVNQTAVDFIVSDNPVVHYNQLFNFRRVFGSAGTASKGLQIFLPLDPRKTLVLYDPAVYRVGGNWVAIPVTNPQDVYELNTLQMCSALDNVYFRDEHTNLIALHKKADPYMRAAKATVYSMPLAGKPVEERQRIVAMHKADINTNLNLSMITLRGSAKKWRTDFIKERYQPVAVPRDKRLVDDWKEFDKACEEGKYTPSEYVRYMFDKYGEQWEREEVAETAAKKQSN
jgi:hypothetical protein